MAKFDSIFLLAGEALVGNEAVDQLVKFNAAMADHSTQANPHLIDGIVLSKFDTIDDKVSKIHRCSELDCFLFYFQSSDTIQLFRNFL